MVKLRFKKLYYRIPDGNWPIDDALVLHKKEPWMAKACDHGEKGHEVIVEYRHKILLDLFLLKIQIEWTGKGETCQNLKTTSQVSE